MQISTGMPVSIPWYTAKDLHHPSADIFEVDQYRKVDIASRG